MKIVAGSKLTKIENFVERTVKNSTGIKFLDQRKFKWELNFTEDPKPRNPRNLVLRKM